MRVRSVAHSINSTYWYALYTFRKKFLDIILWIELLDEGRRNIKSVCQKEINGITIWMIIITHLSHWSYPIGLETTISTWGSAFDSRMMLYTSFLVAPGNDFPFHCSTSSPRTRQTNTYDDDTSCASVSAERAGKRRFNTLKSNWYLKKSSLWCFPSKWVQESGLLGDMMTIRLDHIKFLVELLTGWVIPTITTRCVGSGQKYIQMAQLGPWASFFNSDKTHLLAGWTICCLLWNALNQHWSFWWWLSADKRNIITIVIKCACSTFFGINLPPSWWEVYSGHMLGQSGF